MSAKQWVLFTVLQRKYKQFCKVCVTTLQTQYEAVFVLLVLQTVSGFQLGNKSTRNYATRITVRVKAFRKKGKGWLVLIVWQKHNFSKVWRIDQNTVTLMFCHFGERFSYLCEEFQTNVLTSSQSEKSSCPLGQRGKGTFRLFISKKFKRRHLWRHGGGGSF